MCRDCVDRGRVCAASLSALVFDGCAGAGSNHFECKFTSNHGFYYQPASFTKREWPLAEILMRDEKHGVDTKLENKGMGEKRRLKQRIITLAALRISDVGPVQRPNEIAVFFHAPETNKGCKFVLTPRSILFGSPEAGTRTTAVIETVLFVC
ncbi:unnamed protein product [Leptosia nina]|uniref:Uncharacterized protein n=1 Tax=Leptosia nina TaxID=320188 RepID=A0AAV1JM96_9NEOP